MPTAVEMLEVSKRYGTAAALDHVSLSIAQGQVLGLLGHNGAGKSTLIKLLLGLIRPTGGQITVLGQRVDCDRHYGFRAKIGYLPENAGFYGNLTGREVLDYLGRLKRVPPAQRRALLHRVGLAAAADRAVRTYSKGMRQRLGVAQALLGDPELLLFDEPTSGLDPLAAGDFFSCVAELRAAGRTVVICSHLLGELEPHLDAAVILSGGRKLAQGSMDELSRDAALPIHFTVRVAAGWQSRQLREHLAAVAPACVRDEAGRVEFDVPAAQKVCVLRHLAAVPEVLDIDIQKPTLARLYRRTATLAAGAQAESP